MMKHMSMDKGTMAKCPMMTGMNDLKASVGHIGNDHNEPRAREPR